jgi:hypothetical protein
MNQKPGFRTKVRAFLLKLILKIQSDLEHAEKIDQHIRTQREKVFLQNLPFRN